MMSDERCKSSSIHKNARPFIEDSHDYRSPPPPPEHEENKENRQIAEMLGVDEAEVARF